MANQNFAKMAGFHSAGHIYVRRRSTKGWKATGISYSSIALSENFTISLQLSGRM